jgi:single-strand DNA-binding protein
MANQTNQVVLSGRLPRDPEELNTENLTGARFTIANNRNVGKGKDKREETSFFDCVVWGPTAEYALDYLQKGNKVTIQGRIKQSRWEDKDGNQRQKVEIVVGTIESHGKGSAQESRSESSSKKSRSGDKRPKRRSDPEPEEVTDADDF